MNRWKKFLRLRKQKDSIKLMLLLAAAAMGFAGSAIIRGVSLYGLIQSPVEYVVSGSAKDLSNLENLPYFAAVSPQQECSRTLIYQGREYLISGTILSEEYLNIVYQIQSKGVTETYYVNQPVLRQMNAKEQDLLVLCASGESQEDAKVSGTSTVRLVLAEGIRDKEKPQIYLSGGRSQPQMDGSGDGGLQRICFFRQDLSGSQRRELEKLGFSIENQEAFLEMEYCKTELLLRIRYDVLIAILLAAGALWAYKCSKT